MVGGGRLNLPSGMFANTRIMRVVDVNNCGLKTTFNIIYYLLYSLSPALQSKEKMVVTLTFRN